MKRRKFIEVAGISAFAVSATGFNIIQKNGNFSTDCATSRDMLGPFFRENAPLRNDLRQGIDNDEISIKVIGTLYGADCNSPLPNTEIDIWHCDHTKKYDMDSPEYRCRGKIVTNEAGEYWFKTVIPPPYAGRPKHIHYLIDGVSGYQSLATQLYFKGDPKIKKNNWIKYPWDEKRILDIYENDEREAEVRLDIFLTAV